MPTCIIKLTKGDQSKYLFWSTISDAPTSYGMTKEELVEEIRFRHGEEGIRELPARLERVERRGYSWIDDHGTLEDFLSCNRAGDAEEELTPDQIWEKYCKEDA